MNLAARVIEEIHASSDEINYFQVKKKLANQNNYIVICRQVK